MTIDGVVIYDKTSAAITTPGNGFPVIGSGNYDGFGSPVTFQPLRWNQSLLIEIASSISETDKLTVYWNYEVHA